MKTTKDFQTMFGPADAGFERSVRRTLNEIGREGNTVRAKMRLGLVAAILLSLLLAAAALAAVASKWGVLDFVTKRTAEDTKVLPEATALVQDAESIPQTGGHLPSADFSVRQAVYDGSQIYLVVAIKGKDDGALLIDDWCAPSDPASEINPGHVNGQETIAEFAKNNGKARILAAGVSPSTDGDWLVDGGGYSSNCRMEEDGTLAYLIEGDLKGLPEITIALDCSLTPFAQGTDGGWNENSSAKEKGKLVFKLNVSESSIGGAQNVEPVEFPEVGVRVDSLTLTGTPMAVYYRIEYAVTDSEKLAALGGMTFEFLNERGEKLSPGAGSPGGFEPVEGLDYVDGAAPMMEWKGIAKNGSLNAMEALPEAVTLAACDADGKTIYEAHEIKLK